MAPNQVTCTSCSRPFNERMKNCPFCSAERTPSASHTAAQCPLCKCELVQEQYQDEIVNRCPDCNGLWLNKNTFDKLTSERHVLTDASIPYEYVKGPLENRVQYLPCPSCNKPMVRENFRSISGVIIDKCGDHGVWFDADELERVRCFIANGGVDKSQDKSILSTAEALDTLRSRVNDLELMEKILNKWKWNRIRYRGL